jgi:hypothetical protein
MRNIGGVGRCKHEIVVVHTAADAFDSPRAKTGARGKAQAAAGIIDWTRTLNGIESRDQIQIRNRFF